MRLPSRSALAAVVSAIALAWPASAQVETAAEALFIDVSHHSGQIDWKAVADQGFALVYLKASEGVDDADPMFGVHWEALGELGIMRGAYHFYVTEDDPEAQAEFFLSRVSHEPGDLAPVVDIETLGRDTPAGLPQRLRRFLEIVEQRVGATPIIYTGTRFWNAHLDGSFGRYPLWIAEYEVAEPALPNGWSEWLFWQFEGDAEVDGVEKGADRSRIREGADLGDVRLGPSSGGGG